MAVIRLSSSTHQHVVEHLFSAPGEHFGFLLARTAESTDGPIFLVDEFHPIPDEKVTRKPDGWEIETETIIEAVNEAVRSDRALVEVHNHPGDWAGFSQIDREGFAEFVPYVLDSLPQKPYSATVWTESTVHGEYFLQSGETGKVRSITAHGENLSQLRLSSKEIDEARFDRQEPWFTEDGQRQLATLRVGIVGLGGTGSQVVQSLAYLGTKDFVLVDDDSAEQTNMNRLVTGIHADTGTPKTILARRQIRTIVPKATVDIVSERLQSLPAIEQLKSVDVAFGCVDNDGARLILNELCLAYRIPLIDVGVGIEAREGDVDQAGGRIATVLPGGPCLDCMDLIDQDEAKYFLADSEAQAEAEELGYVEGTDQPAPSVVSINGTIASSAVTEFAILVSGVRRTTPLSYLDVVGNAHEVPGQRLTPMTVEKKFGCYQCGLTGSGEQIDVERFARSS